MLGPVTIDEWNEFEFIVMTFMKLPRSYVPMN